VSCALLSVCVHLIVGYTRFILQRKIKDTLDAAILFRPHAVVTVDSKGFSFRLLQQLKCKALSGIIFTIPQFHSNN
jgi:hypothetical protein